LSGAQQPLFCQDHVIVSLRGAARKFQRLFLAATDLFLAANTFSMLHAVATSASEHKITIILAPPAEIKRRIIKGEAVDVAMSGSAVIGDLIQQGKIVRDSKLTLARVGMAWRFAPDQRSRTSRLSKPSGARCWPPDQSSILTQQSAEQAASISRRLLID
jgi:hypothetical protein